MGTSLRIYQIRADKKGALKRQANISLLVNYIFPLGLIVYQVVRTRFETRFLIFALIFFACVTGLILYSIKRSNRRIDGMKLEINDEQVTLTEQGKADQQIKIADITAVAPHVKGMELKGRSTSKNAFIILQEFEKFEEIKKLLEARVARNLR